MGTAATQTRHNRTITVDFQDETTSFRLLDEGKAFVEFVLAFFLSLGFQLTHTATCRGGGCLDPPLALRPSWKVQRRTGTHLTNALLAIKVLTRVHR